MEVYLVGGAVRDQLLGIPVKDRDWVVVGATQQQMLDQGYQQVGKDFPVFLHPDTKDEYALARTERKTGRGYSGFTVHADPDVSLEDDLKRRDLTLNAIAQTSTGELIDPYEGKKDLEARQLRHISPAFVEDPLRILRVARIKAQLHAFDFTIAAETKALMLSMTRAGELNDLVPERVWQEVEKALATDYPAVFFNALRECGALQILFPELDALFGVPASPKWHPEIDSGVHTLKVLQHAVKLSDDSNLRFAVLVHDFGKAVTPQSEWPKHIAHGKNGVALIKQFCKRYRIPNDYRDFAILVSNYHINSHQCFEAKEKGLLRLLENTDAFRRPDRFKAFLLACEADANARSGREEETYKQHEFLIKVYDAANAIDVAEIVAQGFKNAAIGEELHRQRLTAIKQLLKHS